MRSKKGAQVQPCGALWAGQADISVLIRPRSHDYPKIQILSFSVSGFLVTVPRPVALHHLTNSCMESLGLKQIGCTGWGILLVPCNWPQDTCTPDLMLAAGTPQFAATLAGVAFLGFRAL